MSLSFVQWACSSFDRKNFSICGNSLKSVRRNVVLPLFNLLESYKIPYSETKGENKFTINFLGRINTFYLFGGYDERSFSHIQGLTLAGVLFDEVVLMPESFVSQAIARCSVVGSKFWFNCNPDGPYHWFYKEYVKKIKDKNLLYLHFTMEDNPSLDDEIKKRYRGLYSGSFYRRYILGKWVGVEGLIYPNFSKRNIYKEEGTLHEKYYISCDYGTVNPSSFGLWGLYNKKYYRIKEYYYQDKNSPRTDNQHFLELLKLAGDRKIEEIIVDPSAASFIQVIINHGRFKVTRAKNDVENGIRKVSNSLETGLINISSFCKDSIREFALYRWKENSQKAQPVKQGDHAMDDIRYFVSEILKEEEKNVEDFFVLGFSRGEENV